jgi:Protein-disulfide isomerase
MTGQRLAPAVTDLDHAQGDESALVTLIEYGDFECPHCGRAYPVLKRVKRSMGGRLRFVFRNFPIADNHPHAEHAAEAAESVATLGGNDAFWLMHDQLFEHQRALEDADLARYAEEAGVDGKAVLEDLADATYRQYVRDSFMQGVRAGVNGTPTLFINGIRYDGPRDEETLLAALALVADEGAGPNAAPAAR